LSGRFKRAILVVCDSLGVGELPDAAEFGDTGADTLGHVLASRVVRIPNLFALGLGNLTPTFEGARNPHPEGAFGRMAEASVGKDTATGHWEIAGLLTRKAFRTYPNGFPPEIVRRFEERIGRRVLGNKAASGTEILKELGEDHVRTGSPILYTSADSVFQVAAHEDVIPLDELYRICRAGYDIVCLDYGVCRVIARPFVGRGRDEYRRTSNRRDFAVPPEGETLLDHLVKAGWPVFDPQRHGQGRSRSDLHQPRRFRHPLRPSERRRRVRCQSGGSGFPDTRPDWSLARRRRADLHRRPRLRSLGHFYRPHP
jgi:phosphopentomutase